MKNRLPEIPKGVSGLVLTQFSDVENEKNGLLNYDRTPKNKTHPPEQLAKILREWLKPWNGDQGK